MKPVDFLASLERHQAEIANQPDPAQEFIKTQFQGILDTLLQSNKAMLSFLKSYSPDVTVTNQPDSIKTPDVLEVTKAVKALEKALKPLKNDNSDVIQAIKSLKLSPTYTPSIQVAPTPVTVAAPIVKVDAPDLSSITKAIEANKTAPVDLKPVVTALKAVQKSVDTKPTPVANTPTDPLIYYLPADIDDANAVQYFGYTDNKGAWYIRKYDTSISPKTLRFAFGQANYATNFTNRASLTYSVWGS